MDPALVARAKAILANVHMGSAAPGGDRKRHMNGKYYKLAHRQAIEAGGLWVDYGSTGHAKETGAQQTLAADRARQAEEDKTRNTGGVYDLADETAVSLGSGKKRGGRRIMIPDKEITLMPMPKPGSGRGRSVKVKGRGKQRGGDFGNTLWELYRIKYPKLTNQQISDIVESNKDPGFFESFVSGAKTAGRIFPDVAKIPIEVVLNPAKAADPMTYINAVKTSLNSADKINKGKGKRRKGKGIFDSIFKPIPIGINPRIPEIPKQWIDDLIKIPRQRVFDEPPSAYLGKDGEIHNAWREAQERAKKGGRRKKGGRLENATLGSIKSKPPGLATRYNTALQSGLPPPFISDL